MSTASSSGPSSTESKKSRAPISLADSCRTCRLRKVKCTGNPSTGPCNNCARLRLACSFTDLSGNTYPTVKVSRLTPSQSHTEAGTLRKRAQRACSLCHSHKTKCSGDLPKCRRCEAGGLLCEYKPAKRRFANAPLQEPGAMDESPGQTSVLTSPQSSLSPLGSAKSAVKDATGSDERKASDSSNSLLLIDASSLTAAERLMRKDLILRHFDTYMENLYSLPVMGFLHPATTYHQIHEGTIDPAKAAAICSVSSFFVNPGTSAKEFGAKCNEELEMHLFQNIYKFESDTLLLAGLNMVFNFLNLSFSKVWACMGIATRIMLGLQANWEGYIGGTTFVEQECHRRVVWQIWFYDAMLAGGYDEYLGCRREVMKIRLPCSEIAFRENRTVEAERLHDDPGKSRNAIGLAAWQIRLTDVRHRIQVATRKLMPGANTNFAMLEPSQIMAEINGLQTELNRIHASLPEEIRLSDASIARYMPSQERAGYVYLHGHLSVSHMDLYRFSLPNLLEQSYSEGLPQLPLEFVTKCQKQSVGHALCLARYYEVLQDYSSLQVPKGIQPALTADCTVAHMVTNAMRILLIGIQYNLFEDLEKLTTAPLWRYEPPTELDIRRMMYSMLRISEPYCEMLPIVREAHKLNVAMLEDFDRTRKFTDLKAPGTHFVLERIPGSTFNNKPQNRPRSLTVEASADLWLSAPAPAAIDPSRISAQQHEPADYSAYAPPGIPPFLAQFRNLEMTKALQDQTGSAAEEAVDYSATGQGWMEPITKPVPWATQQMVGINPGIHMTSAESASMMQPSQTIFSNPGAEDHHHHHHHHQQQQQQLQQQLQVPHPQQTQQTQPLPQPLPQLQPQFVDPQQHHHRNHQAQQTQQLQLQPTRLYMPTQSHMFVEGYMDQIPQDHTESTVYIPPDTY